MQPQPDYVHDINADIRPHTQKSQNAVVDITTWQKRHPALTEQELSATLEDVIFESLGSFFALLNFYQGKQGALNQRVKNYLIEKQLLDEQGNIPQSVRILLAKTVE